MKTSTISRRGTKGRTQGLRKGPCWRQGPSRPGGGDCVWCHKVQKVGAGGPPGLTKVWPCPGAVWAPLTSLPVSGALHPILSPGSFSRRKLALLSLALILEFFPEPGSLEVRAGRASPPLLSSNSPLQPQAANWASGACQPSCCPARLQAPFWHPLCSLLAARPAPACVGNQECPSFLPARACARTC